MVHAENNDVIRWVSQKLLESGRTAPKYHATSHVALAEAEATHRVIQLSKLFDVPVLIVHVSAPDAIATIGAAQRIGAQVYGETCPHYMLLTEDDHGPARRRRSEVLLQPAAARQGGSGSDLEGAEGRRAANRLVGSCALSL